MTDLTEDTRTEARTAIIMPSPQCAPLARPVVKAK